METSNRIPIFLDVDGVLNTVGTHGILPEPLNNLNDFLEGVKDQVYIVISSTWRVHDMDKLKAEAGPLLSSLIVGGTPVLSEDFVLGNRSREVNMYLSDFHYSGKYLIIDDMPSWFTAAHQGKKELYIINNSVGFTKQDGTNIMKLLSVG